MKNNTIKSTKLFTIAFTAVLLAGSGVAVQGFNGDESQPHITTQPDQAPSNVTPNASLPSLPELPGNASETAQQVLDSISNSFQNGLNNLGEVLQNLLNPENSQG